MHLKHLYLCLLLFSVDLKFLSCAADDVELNCNSTCTCNKRRVGTVSIEYRAICEGDGTKNVVLSENIFEKEPIPDWTRMVYVRLANFTGANITEEFLSRWSAYTSCSLDIWHSGRVVFPPKVSRFGETYAFKLIFAGIAMASSSVESFPDGIFQNKSIGFKLINTTIDYLNLIKLGTKNINYLTMRNSVVKLFDGHHSRSSTLAKSTSRGDPIIEIHDSKIGYLSHNSLAFNDYQSYTNAKISIKRSVLGFMEATSLRIGQNISLEIADSTLSYVSPNTLTFAGHNTPSSITGNVIGVEYGSMQNLMCDRGFQIRDNLIYSREILSECILDGFKQESSAVCNDSFDVSNYIDSSCDNNYVIGEKYFLPRPTEIPTTTILTTTTPNTRTPPATNTSSSPKATTTTLTSITPISTSTTSDTKLLFNTTTITTSDKTLPNITLCIPITTFPPTEMNVSSFASFSGKLTDRSAIPFGLFCVVVGVCFCLFIAVIVLIGVLAHNRKHKKTVTMTEDRQCTSCEEAENLYELPRAHFVPNSEPQVTLRLGTFKRAKKTENSNQEQAECSYSPVMERNGKIQLVEDDNFYINMN